MSVAEAKLKEQFVMASGSDQDKPMLLGFVDDYMSDDKEHFTTNKVGGLPDWDQKFENPKCGECGQGLVLVTQIYAPLSSIGPQYHRTLYFFSCLQPRCWNKPRSWTCLRYQVLVEEKKSEPLVMSKEVKNTTDWINDAEDWGDEDEDDMVSGELNSFNFSQPSNSNHLNTTTTAIQLQQPKTSALNAQLHNLNITDDNGNVDKLAKAEAKNEAIAEIEMDTEDIDVTIDLPDCDKNIPNLFSLGNRNVELDMKIIPFYIWVEEEKFEKEENITDHELKLINEYKARESINAVQSSGGGSKKSTNKSVCQDDQYEKSVPSHGDESFHKFLTVIGYNPGQILRYGRQSQSGPLLLRPLSQSVCDLKCQYCGSQLSFEFQILPSLVSQMSVRGLEGVPVEFGTILVFTCHVSCWIDSSCPRIETVLVQQEAM